MDTLSRILIWILVGGLSVSFVFLVLDMVIDALTGKSLTARFSSKEEDTFQWEDDLNEIRRILESLESEEDPPKASPKSPSPYEGLTKRQLHQMEKEVDEKMSRMR